MQGKSILRVFIIVSCVAVTALGYRNSSGDNTDAVAAASRAACDGDTCRASLGQSARSSFGHEYSFTVQNKSGKSDSRTVIVECKRELIFLGDWACKLKP